MTPHHDCAAYYRRRAAEEQKKAERAPNVVVREAYIELADLLTERALILERAVQVLH